MGEFSVTIDVKENGKKSPNFSLDGDLDGVQTFEDLQIFTKKALIAISGEVLDEEQAAGFTKKPVTIVDGRHNKSPFDVDPFGKIEFLSPVDLDKIILPIYESILALSPVKSGNYLISNFVFFNTQRVATNLEELKAWLATNPTIEDKDKIRFVDVQPYAGKLERYGRTRNSEGTKNIGNIKTGKTKDRKTKLIGEVRKPNGVYKQTEVAIRRKFGKNALIAFEFVPGSIFGLPRYPNSKHEYVYPTILVYLFKSGLT